jgi:hypothetical protein
LAGAAGIGWYRLASAGIGWYRLVSAGIGWYRRFFNVLLKSTNTLSPPQDGNWPSFTSQVGSSTAIN